MPTIKEVADLAGVSVGTVSHVITGSVQVSEQLRAKVTAAIRQLDYHPNHIARSLKTSKTRTLGIIVPDMTIPFFPRVIRGAESVALVHGYSLIAVNSDDRVSRQSDLLTLFRSQRMEGILLVPAAGPVPFPQISRTVAAGVPMVCVDRIPDGLQIDSVSVENGAAAEMGVAHLVAMGHRRIAIVTGPLTLKNEKERLEGCRLGLERAGLPLDQDLIWEGNLRPEDVGALCERRLRNSRDLPDAVFSTNGPTGLGVLHGLRSCGLKTPGDIAMVTFDELTVEDLFSPSITTVVQPAFEIGARAAEILLQRMARPAPPDQPISIRLPATLKLGDSSRPGRRRLRTVRAVAGAPGAG
jgi:DNA-binding LacI/PurR family transcriptional regulator